MKSKSFSLTDMIEWQEGLLSQVEEGIVEFSPGYQCEEIVRQTIEQLYRLRDLEE